MNILIVDDNTQIRQSLEDMLHRICEDRIWSCGHAAEALALVQEDRLSVDLLLMDIQLGDEDGIALAEAICTASPRTQVIFMSGFDDYYLDVYAVDHVYFLRKPISQEHLERAYQRACDKIKTAAKDVFVFTAAHHKYQLPYREILYFEKFRRKVLIHVAGREAPLEYYATMPALLAKLPRTFVRCHNSYVVNLHAVTEYRRGCAQIGACEIPVSRSYEAAFREAFYGNLQAQITAE